MTLRRAQPKAEQSKGENRIGVGAMIRESIFVSVNLYILLNFNYGDRTIILITLH